jgi:hypothetical protein
MNGQELRIPLAEYLALDAVSSGGVGDFNERPALFHAKHVARTIITEQTAPMLLGSAIHCLVLEGREEFDLHYAVGPCDDKRTTKWKKWAEDALLVDGVTDSHGRSLLTASQGEVVEACRQALVLHDDARKVLFDWPGTPELSGTWNDDETGLLCKVRFDRNLTTHASVVELKTARSCLPDSVHRSAVSNGFHIRGAFYTDGYREIYGATPNAMTFITVDTELDPRILEDRVYVWDLTPDLEALGAREVRKALDGIAACHASGVWRADWSRGVHAIDVPRYLQNTI